MRTTIIAALFACGLTMAGCADYMTPPPEPVGVAPADFPPGTVPPHGLVGPQRVGADTLADPEIRTAGDPFL